MRPAIPPLDVAVVACGPWPGAASRPSGSDGPTDCWSSVHGRPVARAEVVIRGEILQQFLEPFVRFAPARPQHLYSFNTDFPPLRRAYLGLQHGQGGVVMGKDEKTKSLAAVASASGAGLSRRPSAPSRRSRFLGGSSIPRCSIPAHRAGAVVPRIALKLASGEMDTSFVREARRRCPSVDREPGTRNRLRGRVSSRSTSATRLSSAQNAAGALFQGIPGAAGPTGWHWPGRGAPGLATSCRPGFSGGLRYRHSTRLARDRQGAIISTRCPFHRDRRDGVGGDNVLHAALGDPRRDRQKEEEDRQPE